MSAPLDQLIDVNEDDPDFDIIKNMNQNDLSKPYYWNASGDDKSCKYSCFRSTTKILAFMIGIVIWLKEFIGILFGCLGTYKIPTDDEFIKLLETPFPYGVLVKKQILTFPNEQGIPVAEEVKIISTSFMNEVKDNIRPGTYINSTEIVFRISMNVWYIYSIKIGDIILYKNLDGNSHGWELAKSYTLSAINYEILLIVHPTIHFGQEKLITLMKVKFPIDNEIRQLLEPHNEFTSEVNEGVLETKYSPLFADDTACCMYDVHTINRAGNQKLIGYGYNQWIHTDNIFGDVPISQLKSHYDAILILSITVVNSMLDRIASLNNINLQNEEYNRLQYFVEFMKRNFYYNLNLELDITQVGSPGAIQIAQVLADNIFDVSVRHSFEHHFMSKSEHRIHPMIIAKEWDKNVVLPYTSGPTPCCAWKCGLSSGSGSVVPLRYWLRQLMYNTLFIEWWNNRLFADGRLHKTEYRFTTINLQIAAQNFRNNLEDIPDTNSVPRNRIAKSIQW